MGVGVDLFTAVEKDYVATITDAVVSAAPHGTRKSTNLDRWKGAEGFDDNTVFAVKPVPGLQGSVMTLMDHAFQCGRFSMMKVMKPLLLDRHIASIEGWPASDVLPPDLPLSIEM